MDACHSNFVRVQGHALCCWQNDFLRSHTADKALFQLNNVGGASPMSRYLAILDFAVRIRHHFQEFHNIGMRQRSQYANFPDGSNGKPALIGNACHIGGQRTHNEHTRLRETPKIPYLVRATATPPLQCAPATRHSTLGTMLHTVLNEHHKDPISV